LNTSAGGGASGLVITGLPLRIRADSPGAMAGEFRSTTQMAAARARPAAPSAAQWERVVRIAVWLIVAAYCRVRQTLCTLGDLTRRE
jgi:hypothetical protein